MRVEMGLVRLGHSEMSPQCPLAGLGWATPRGLHSITSSARASSAGGTVRPSVFAVLRDYQFELCGLLYRQISGLGTFENFFNVAGRPTVKIGLTCSVGHEAARFDILPQSMYRRQPSRKVGNPLSMAIRERVLNRDQRIETLLCGSLKGAIEIVGA
jgi:hypothetical protein